MKKKHAKLDTVFDCPYCGYQKTVNVFIDTVVRIGKLQCGNCGASFEASVNRLEEEIDVYAKWIDACDAASKAEQRRFTKDLGNQGNPSRV